MLKKQKNKIRLFLWLKIKLSSRFRPRIISWVFVFWGIIVILLFTGLGPVKWLFRSIRALNQDTEIINLYSSNCRTDSNPDSYTSGWWNIEKTKGAPDLSPTGGIIDFSSENSAFYQGGKFSLSCSGFKPLSEEAEVSPSAIENRTNINDDLPVYQEIIYETNANGDSVRPGGEEAVQQESGEEAIQQENIEEIIEEDKAEDIAEQDITEESPASAVEVVNDFKKLPEETLEVITEDLGGDKASEGEVNIIDAPEADILPKEMPIESQEDTTADSAEEKEVSWLDEAKNWLGRGEALAQEFIKEKISRLSDLGDFQEAKIMISMGANMPLEEAKPDIENEAVDYEVDIKTKEETKTIDEPNSSPADSIESEEANTIPEGTETIQENEAPATTQENDIVPAEVEIISGEQPDETVEIDNINDKEQDNEIEIIEEKTIETEAPAESGNDEKLISYLSSLLEAKEARAQTGMINEAKVIIWYTTEAAEAADNANTGDDNRLWQKLDTISDSQISNAVNGGYFSYEAPFLKSWEDINNLEIKITGLIDDDELFTIYIDSVWVEAKYVPSGEKEKIVKRMEWEKALEMISKKTVFKINEKGEMRFRYNKNEERIWDTLKEIIGFGNFWQTVDVSAEIVDSRGRKVNFPLNMIFEEDGEFIIQLGGDKRELAPGKYTIKFHIEDRSGDEVETFDIKKTIEWGVLAINFNKSEYESGDTGFFQMAVLDELGHTICGAELTIKVISPSKKITYLNMYDNKGLSIDLPALSSFIYRSPYCGPESVTNRPDYYAYYEFSETGDYVIELTAKTPTGSKSIEETIGVGNGQPIMIERIGPTRIYPKADYSIKMMVASKQDFKGEIIETVPSGFKITNYELRITNSSERDPYGSNYNYKEEVIDNEKQLVWHDVELSAGDELEIIYTFDAPNESPELYLLGPLKAGSYEEKREWQIASDAINKRARTVQFLAGTYSGGGTSGQSTNVNQVFPIFNFRLAETGVNIKNAFIIFESQFEAYNVNGGNYSGYNLSFDACEESCTANALSGNGRTLKDDNTVLAYSEAESNQGRIIVDVTKETQLAAYTGNGTEMEGQIGYKLESATGVNSIASAKAILVLTYTYDADSPNLTNTVIYPLDSTDTTPSPADSGAKQEELIGDCTKDVDCPLFDYKMEIPEWAGVATTTNRLANWFTAYMVNDRHGSSDIDITVNIQGTDTDSSNFHHESADGSTQANVAAMIFGSVVGFAENLSQQLEFVPVSPAANNDYDSIGGEVFETYIASSSAPTKTRTVSFPIGVVNNGQTTAQTFTSANVYLPENGSATGTVTIKKAWLRIIASNYNSGAYNTNITTKVGASATSSVYNYKYDAGALVPKPSFNIIHIIPSSDYGALEEANANNGVEIILSTQNDSVVTGGLSAELMITYTYSDESSGYLTSLQLFAGQTDTNPATSTSATTSPAVMPEVAGKTIRGASLLVSYLNSDSLGDVGAGTVFKLDADLSVNNPSCSPSFVVEPDDINTFSEFYKDVTGGMNTTDGQIYNICLADDETLTTSDGAKANGILTYTYQWENSPPTGAFITASTTQKNNGSGMVDIGIEINDPDGQDARAKIEYATGTACIFSPAKDPTVNTVDADITADYGDPDADNSLSYQIGTPSAYIETASGSNSVFFDWQAEDNLGSVEGDFCLRLTANDLLLDQTAPATTTVYIDTLAPSAPGVLSLNSRTGTAITVNYGATSTETNFREYIIYYKQFDGLAPGESDLIFASTSDANLDNQLFNGAATTTISGLTASTTYSFAIWVYDQYGNRASSSRVDITTNDAPSGSFNSAAEKSDASGVVDISIEVDDLNNQDTCRAKLEYVLGADCDFSSPLDPTLDENTGNISADFGSPVINNSEEYQIGGTGGWIKTSPGSNTVQFDWLSRTDLPFASSTYCVRLTVNDRFDDQLAAATTTFMIDNFNPTATGGLSAGEVDTDSVVLIFATNTPATDTSEPSVNAYRIYYKKDTGGVATNDTEHDDAALDSYNYGGSATSTTVTGLDSNSWYVFNIWAYDQYGNRATSTEIAIKTNATLSNDSLAFMNPLSQGSSNNIALAGTTTEWNIRAVVSETNGWYAIGSTTLRLADNSDNSAPYGDLAFRWEQTGQNFSEVGSDSANAVLLSSNSTSTCAVNTCVLDFYITVNKSFASSSVNYTAEIYSDNDFGTIDHDVYADFYQVRFPYRVQAHYRWRSDDGGE